MRTPRFKQKPVTLVLLLCLPIAALFCWQHWTAPLDPLLNGHRLSTHLLKVYGGVLRFPKNATPQQIRLFNDEFRNSRTALASLSSEQALPLLLDWMESPRQRWQLQFGQQLRKLGLSFPSFEADRQQVAISFLSQQPFPSEQVLWSLLRILTNSSAHPALRQSAAFAFHAILLRTELVDKVKLGQALVPVEVQLRSAGGRAAWLLDQSICHCGLDDTSRYLTVLQSCPDIDKIHAVHFLGEQARDSDRIVPALTPLLRSTNQILLETVLHALTTIGPEARPALPALTNFLSRSESIQLREACTLAISKITARSPGSNL
jgi:hypothetical protein